jgi:hypothetical protein
VADLFFFNQDDFKIVFRRFENFHSASLQQLGYSVGQLAQCDEPLEQQTLRPSFFF